MPECPIDRALPERFEVKDWEDLFIRKNGEFFPVICNARPIRDGESGKGTVIEVLDLTEQKAMAKLLRDSDLRFTQLADAIPQLVFITRPDGYAEWFNERWSEYTGFSHQQLAGWGWAQTHDPKVFPVALQRWKECLATGGIV
ncbi:MAG: PAS domain-containing protein [Bryobacterales bacterium]|nr:PAS domain-containing protein [Bryobacterales bacterium]